MKVLKLNKRSILINPKGIIGLLFHIFPNTKGSKGTGCVRLAIATLRVDPIE